MMARKTESPAKRARYLIHDGEKSKPKKSVMQIWRDDLQASPAELSIAWDNAARAALKVENLKFAFYAEAGGPVPWNGPDPSTDSMRRAFDHFKLDPDDPWSWSLIVRYFAYVFFWQVPPRKRGRKKEWTPDREAELEKAVKNLPGLSALRAAQRLVNDKSSPFYVQGVQARAGVEGLRKKIGEVKQKSSSTKARKK